MVSIGFYQGVACLSKFYFLFFNVWVCFFLFLCIIFSGFLSIWLFNPLIIIISIRYGMVRAGSIKLLDFFGIVCLGFMRCNYVLNFRIWAFFFKFYNLGLSWGCNLKFLVLSTVPFSKIVLDNVWHIKSRLSLSSIYEKESFPYFKIGLKILWAYLMLSSEIIIKISV